MSWIWDCRGKIYHCTACDYAVTVEYEGGPRPTQASDPVVLAQQSLDELYGQPTPEEGTYFHEVGLCENCATDRIAERADNLLSPEQEEEILERLARIEALQEEIENASEEERDSVLARLVSGITLERLQSLAPEAYEASFGARLFKLRNKRSGLVAAYLEAADSPLLDWADASLAADATSRTDRNGPSTDELRAGARALVEILTKSGRYRYEKRDVLAPDSLNPFLVTETSVRWPVEGTQGFSFYYEFELDHDGLIRRCKEVEQPRGASRESWQDGYRAKVRGRLQDLAEIDDAER